jgi:hypothetical protein
VKRDRTLLTRINCGSDNCPASVGDFDDSDPVWSGDPDNVLCAMPECLKKIGSALQSIEACGIGAQLNTTAAVRQSALTGTVLCGCHRLIHHQAAKSPI